MGEEPRVHGDLAYEFAHRLSAARGESVDAVVETALRDLAARREADGSRDEDIFSEEVIARRRSQRAAIIAENRRHLGPVPESDHSDFYDENRLPI